MKLLLHLYIYHILALKQHCWDPRSREYGSASSKLLDPVRSLEEAWTLRFNRIGWDNSFHNCMIRTNGHEDSFSKCQLPNSNLIQDAGVRLNYIIGYFFYLFSQHQVTVFNKNSLSKSRQQISKDVTEQRCKISSTIKKTGVGYSDQSRPVRVARPGSNME